MADQPVWSPQPPAQPSLTQGSTLTQTRKGLRGGSPTPARLPTPPTHTPPGATLQDMNKNLTGGRLAAIIAGGAIASLATLVLLVGAGFQWLEHEKDADGYYNTSSERFSTGTYALSSERLDIDDGVPGAGHWGNARLTVHSEDG